MPFNKQPAVIIDAVLAVNSAMNLNLYFTLLVEFHSSVQRPAVTCLRALNQLKRGLMFAPGR